MQVYAAYKYKCCKHRWGRCDRNGVFCNCTATRNHLKKVVKTTARQAGKKEIREWT